MKKILLSSILISLSSCETDSNGDISISSFGWIIIVLFITFFLLSMLSGQSPKNKERIQKLIEEQSEDKEDKLERQKQEYFKKIEEEKEAAIEPYKDYESFYVGIAGIYYRTKEAKEMIDFLTVDNRIELEHEKRNRYDKNAVAVYASGTKIGYIPAENAEYVCNLIKEDKIIKAFAWDHSFGYYDKWATIRVFHK